MARARAFWSRCQGRLVVWALPSMTAPATPKQPALSFSPLRNPGENLFEGLVVLALEGFVAHRAEGAAGLLEEGHHGLRTADIACDNHRLLSLQVRPGALSSIAGAAGECVPTS